MLAAAGNNFLLQFGTLIQEFFRDLRVRVLVDEAEGRRAGACHAAILAALRDRDAERTQQLMDAHLQAHARRRGALATSAEAAPCHLNEGEHTDETDPTSSSQF